MNQMARKINIDARTACRRLPGFDSDFPKIFQHIAHGLDPMQRLAQCESATGGIGDNRFYIKLSKRFLVFVAE